jgi:DNA invertase Pin-like site-specific DNA recombinase
MPIAYSYIRFSSKKQEQNDSVKRQTRLRDEWLRQNQEMTLDTTISLQDLGVSAFRGRNLDPEWGDLGKFIDLAERHDSPIEKGSVLLLERLDRFSRQRVSIAYTALVRLVHAGIKVVVLDPVAHQIDRENIDQLHVVLPIVTNLCLAHEQSREKSKRISYAWLSRREDARAGRKIFTKRIPAWLRYDEQTKRLELDPVSADAVQHIFKRTSEGIGQVQLVKEMNKQYAPISPQKPNGGTPKWNTSYISKILNDRSVLGEFQPHTMKEGKRRIPDGEPIKDYFPRVISDDLFFQSQYQKSLRKKEKSRTDSTFLNLFTGIVVNHSDSHVMQIQTSRTKRKDGSVYLQRRLWSYGNRRGIAESCPWGLDYYPFEKVMLHALSELNYVYESLRTRYWISRQMVHQKESAN